MKFLIALLITLSFNSYAQFRIERIDTRNDSSQGYNDFESVEEFNKAYNKMLDVNKTWMKCDKWSEEAPTSIVDQVVEFFAEDTCDKFKITKIQKDAEGNEITLYCHPKTFDFKCTDITLELADKKAKEEKDKADLEALHEKYNDGKIKLEELVQFLKLKGI